MRMLTLYPISLCICHPDRCAQDPSIGMTQQRQDEVKNKVFKVFGNGDRNLYASRKISLTKSSGGISSSSSSSEVEARTLKKSTSLKDATTLKQDTPIVPTSDHLDNGTTNADAGNRKLPVGELYPDSTEALIAALGGLKAEDELSPITPTPPAEWECATCTLINESTHLSCIACGLPRVEDTDLFYG